MILKYLEFKDSFILVKSNISRQCLINFLLDVS